MVNTNKLKLRDQNAMARSHIDFVTKIPTNAFVNPKPQIIYLKKIKPKRKTRDGSSILTNYDHL